MQNVISFGWINEIAYEKGRNCEFKNWKIWKQGTKFN